MKGQIGNLMKQAQKVQANTQRAQKEIAKLEVEGQAGDGLVKIFMAGNNETRRVSIDVSLFEDDKDMLEDLVVAAINDASQKVKKITEEHMNAATAGMNLPAGMKLSF